MGISLNVNVNNENEFNQQLQMYLAQGYSMQSNFNGTAILKKKSYSMGLLVVLLIFFFPAAIIYYLVASDDVVTITNNNGQAPSNNAAAGTATESFDSYCEECGHGLFKDSKFCPGCGKKLTAAEEKTAPVEEKEVLKCKKCGRELSEENVFCPECGEKVDASEEENVETSAEEDTPVEKTDDETAETVSQEDTPVEEKEILKCKKCGTELSEENAFCPECGEKVDASEE